MSESKTSRGLRYSMPAISRMSDIGNTVWDRLSATLTTDTQRDHVITVQEVNAAAPAVLRALANEIEGQAKP